MPAMLVQPILVLEHPVAFPTIVMLIVVVLLEVLIVIEKEIAVLAIGVVRALGVVLFEAQPSGEIDPAVVTDVMTGGIAFMLAKSRHALEVTLAAVAVGHY